MYDDLVEFLQESVTPFHAAATAERLADAAQQNGWWACATELIPNTVQIDASKK